MPPKTPLTFDQPETEDSSQTKLRAIYEYDGALPDLKKFEGQKRRGGVLAWTLGAIVLGAILGAGWTGWAALASKNEERAEPLALAIKPSAEIISGAAQNIIIEYRNPSAHTLANAELRLVLPAEFSLHTTEPEPSALPLIWKLGILPPRAQGAISLKGVFFGPAETEAAFQLFASYRPANFNADFQSAEIIKIPITGSALAFAVSAPENVIAGVPTEITYTVKNVSAEEIIGVFLMPVFPKNYLFDAPREPLTKNKDGAYELGALAAGIERKIVFPGSFAAQAGGANKLSGHLLIANESALFEVASSAIEVPVLASDLALRLVVNGSSDDALVEFGAPLRVTLEWQNNGEVSMRDLIVTLTSDATPDTLLDWARFDAETEKDKTFMRKDENLIMNKKLRKELKELAPKAKGEVSFSLPTKKRGVKDGKDYAARFQAVAVIGAVGAGAASKTVSTAVLTERFVSDLTVQAEARYFDKDLVPIGSGSLPPRVGDKTRYIIFWTLENSVHELADLKMSARLPEHLEWTDKSLSEAGLVHYDFVTREVSWEIARLPGVRQKVAAQFEIELAPETSDVDTFAPLLTASILSATDVVTNSELTRELAPLTSELPEDKNAKGKGLVKGK